jgi:hypothetical protein
VRIDCPDLDPAQQVNWVSRRDPDGKWETRSEPVPPVPPELRPWVDDAVAYQVSGRLLE